MRKLGIALLSLTFSFGLSHAQSANAAVEIIQDGTFQNSIGTNSSLNPWSDWTNAGVTRAAAPSGVPGNYASIPVGGDLFQRFSPLADGTYQLRFLAENQATHDAQLVFSLQQALGISTSITFPQGLGGLIILQGGTGFQSFEFQLTVSSPGFLVNEFYFSNSYNMVEPLIPNSKNPFGTIINVANVSLLRLDASAVPEPGSWALMVSGLGLMGFQLRKRSAALSAT